MSESITVKPVAYVKNKRNDMSDDFWGNVISEITLVDELPAECFDGIDAFSHLEIIYNFNKANPAKVVLSAAHPRENKAWPKVGIFAQRKKDRPNHLGTTIVKLIERKGKTLIVSQLDADDGTPVFDIKPVVKEFLPTENTTQPPWITELMKDYWK